MKNHKSHLSLENQKRLKQLKAVAHERVLKQEFVQFRVDAPMMDLLQKVADHKRKAVGVMLREWTEQKLADEVQLLPLPAVKLPDGTIVTDASPKQQLEKIVFDYQHGHIKLTSKQYQAIMDWLMDHYLAAKYKKQAPKVEIT